MSHDVSLFDLTASLSEAIDLVSPRVSCHNLQTARIAHAVAEEMGIGGPDMVQLVLASCLHDVGGLSLKERLDALAFDAADNLHGETGAALLAQFPPFAPLARIIRCHHDRWDASQAQDPAGREPGLLQGELRLRHILYLADRVDVSLEPGIAMASQATAVTRRIAEADAGRFDPDAVDALRKAAERADFWNALQENSCRERLACADVYPTVSVDDAKLDAMFNLFGRIVDFRSPYTASHSTAVAACAARLGSVCGMDAEQAHLLGEAGFLHDLGKLAVPKELLEKHAPLTNGEHRIIREHPLLSGSVLRPLKAFTQLRVWVSQHHERLDGKGYPCRLAGMSLSLGSRVLAVSDVFVALTETRPYRPAMKLDKALAAMEAMCRDNGLDGDVLAVLRDMRMELDAVRMEAQRQEYGAYRRLVQSVRRV